MKNFYSRVNAFLCFLVFMSLLLFAACDSSSGSDSADTPVVTAADLEGTWMIKSFDPAYEYSEGHEADAMIMEFEGSAYTMIFYYRTEQDGGNKGTFTISGTNLVLASAESWSSDEYWTADPQTISLPFTYNTTTLTVTGPGDEDLALVKTVFALKAALVDTWYSSTEELHFVADGNYTYEDIGAVPYTESGTWDATSDLLRSDTTVQDSLPVSISFLSPYTLSEGDGTTLTLTGYDETGTEEFYEYSDSMPIAEQAEPQGVFRRGVPVSDLK